MDPIEDALPGDETIRLDLEIPLVTIGPCLLAATSADDKSSLPRQPATSAQPVPMPSLDRLEPFPSRPKRKSRKGKKKASGGPRHPLAGLATPPLSSPGGSSAPSIASTPRMTLPRLQDLASGSSSPVTRPSSACAQGGITAMRLQLESLNLGHDTPETEWRSRLQGTDTPNSDGLGVDMGSDIFSSSEGDKTPEKTYEIPLVHQFVKTETRPPSPAPPLARDDSLTRRMSASDFEPLRCLGQGSFGTVLLVRHRASGRLYAQKQFRKASLTVHAKLVEQTKTERAILESISRHAFVVKLYYAFQDDEKLYLILEYAQGGELFTHLALERMFSEDVAAFYLAETVLALEHLHHTVGIVYRDLKPENILLDADGHLLLTDFGLSKVALDGSRDECCRSILGTVEYMAPEVVQGRRYGPAVDWWSLGALAFDLLTGAPPFPGPNRAAIQHRIVTQKVRLPYFLSPDAKDLLTRLLRKDPRRRLGAHPARDLPALKQHRFFRKIDWARLARRQLEPPIRPVITDPALAENFAAQFTGLPLTPLVASFGPAAAAAAAADPNPFGGFSFVASSSLLEAGCWGC
ncbi:MAG: serine/threonine protein kinase psk1 [Phylliscum demangeonii]|nr:MAG: serine/threonine protein kinase psk1 [Phylliscum demangeonii]